MKSFFLCILALIAAAPSPARGQATLLLEEPYSYDGTFAGTGHTAVYLSRICAETPTKLRRCRSGENGVVISRYHHVGGRDWIAVPLIPYLYAVEEPASIPLYANDKLVDFLRRDYLRNNMPDEAPELGPKAPANQLAGSAYDRTTYAFRFATRPEQDDELIRMLNAEPNTETYALLNHNCADFAKQIVNFYYPHAAHRSVIADLGVSTPKQVAKSLVHTAKRDPEMQLQVYIIPQVPGLKRSKPVHGVIESVVLAKKYVTPVLLFHPFMVGTVEVAYWTGWRFNPANKAAVFDAYAADPWNHRDQPLTKEQRRFYRESIEALKSDIREEGAPGWSGIEDRSEPQFDASGRAFLNAKVNGTPVEIGLTRENAFRLAAQPELLQDLVLTRLEWELKPKRSVVSERQVQRDWQMLQRALDERKAELRTNR